MLIHVEFVGDLLNLVLKDPLASISASLKLAFICLKRSRGYANIIDRLAESDYIVTLPRYYLKEFLSRISMNISYFLFTTYVHISIWNSFLSPLNYSLQLLWLPYVPLNVEHGMILTELNEGFVKHSVFKGAFCWLFTCSRLMIMINIIRKTVFSFIFFKCL